MPSAQPGASPLQRVSLYIFPTMLKREERWSSNSITSTFKLLHKDGRPLGCEQNDRLVYSKACGLGWRFAMSHDIEPPEIDIFFNEHVTSSELGSLTVAVMLQFDGSNDEEYVDLYEQTITLGELDVVRLASWRPHQIATHSQLTFKVSFTAASLDLPQPRLQVETCNALERSLRTGVFLDTRFFVFSQRLRPGQVGRPLALFANGSLLQEKSNYFKTHLSGKRPSESPLIDLGEDFAWGEAFTDKYDYESDSDLDDEGEYTFDRSQPPASVYESTADVENRPDAKISEGRPSEQSTSPTHFQTVGRMVLVIDTAFKTWQALIMYLYSGDIKFLPLKSQTYLSPFARDILPNTIACSPKSMYRLATKMGLHNMKALALSSVKEGLSKQNILEEVFSTFTSRYPAIMEMEMDVLFQHYSSPEVLEAFPAKMEKVAMGELPHSAKILTSLYKKLAESRTPSSYTESWLGSQDSAQTPALPEV